MLFGKMPPNEKLKQINLFNNSEKSIIIATDAIGMGVNLKIKRIIFTSLYKTNNHQNIKLLPSEIKQIAGRAGRDMTGGKIGFSHFRYRKDIEKAFQIPDGDNKFYMFPIEAMMIEFLMNVHFNFKGTLHVLASYLNLISSCDALAFYDLCNICSTLFARDLDHPSPMPLVLKSLKMNASYEQILNCISEIE